MTTTIMLITGLIVIAIVFLLIFISSGEASYIKSGFVGSPYSHNNIWVEHGPDFQYEVSDDYYASATMWPGQKESFGDTSLVEEGLSVLQRKNAFQSTPNLSESIRCGAYMPAFSHYRDKIPSTMRPEHTGDFDITMDNQPITMPANRQTFGPYSPFHTYARPGDGKFYPMETGSHILIEGK